MNKQTLPALRILLLSGLVIADTASVIALFQSANFLLFTLLHGLISLLSVAVLVWKTPVNKSKQPAFFIYSFLFQLIVILPVIGLIGAFIFSHHKLFINEKDKHDEEIDDLLIRSESDTLELALEKDKKYRELLRYQDPESYLHLILSTQYMDEYNAIRILKIGLNTDIENVRLLAQARLDSKENAINKALENNIKLSKVAKHRKNIHLHLEIAQQYWNLANLGLAKDAVLDHVLEQLQKYTNIVKSITPYEPQSYHLSAKGLLLGKRYQEAKKQFQLAIKAGMPKNKIIPLLNEIAFCEHRQGQKPSYFKPQQVKL